MTPTLETTLFLLILLSRRGGAQEVSCIHTHTQTCTVNVYINEPFFLAILCTVEPWLWKFPFSNKSVVEQNYELKIAPVAELLSDFAGICCAVPFLL